MRDAGDGHHRTESGFGQFRSIGRSHMPLVGQYSFPSNVGTLRESLPFSLGLGFPCGKLRLCEDGIASLRSDHLTSAREKASFLQSNRSDTEPEFRTSIGGAKYLSRHSGFRRRGFGTFAVPFEALALGEPGSSITTVGSSLPGVRSFLGWAFGLPPPRCPHAEHFPETSSAT